MDIGVERPLLIADKKLPINKRVTVKITKAAKQPKVALADSKSIQTYWGYHVTSTRGSFGKLTKSRNYDLVIATSKIGAPLTQVRDELAERWKQSDNILVAFGAPSRGLAEIVSQEKLSLDKVADFTVNTIPNQGTETVRTEEALYASLALLNIICD
ncbi:MAG: hypothetical protein CW691_11785 [Candidatus Bathyarchaeum sp.]|nr:MAG: hypothetical protein CW691_11785 [Candidatus Bathyarchaeum sp.]